MRWDEMRWDKRGTNGAEQYIFFHGKGKKQIPNLFIHQGIVSSVESEVTERDITALKVFAPNKHKSDNIKSNFVKKQAFWSVLKALYK